VKVVIAEAAKADLAEIAHFIAQDNPVRAETFVDELLDRCRHLAVMPNACALIPRYKRGGIRRCVHGNYLIFHRVFQDRIEVIHVLHGARDYESLLFADD